MAVVTVRSSGERFETGAEIAAFLGRYGIWHRHFEGIEDLPEGATDQEILDAFKAPIEELSASGGYVTADVINVSAETPGLQEMLDRFNREHWHDEDEVRFIVAGRGLFHIHPRGGEVFSIEVTRGDMINVPRGTEHWFDLCGDRRIRAIRLFQDRAGWTPHYTESGVDRGFEPVCFGPRYIPPAPPKEWKIR